MYTDHSNSSAYVDNSNSELNTTTTTTTTTSTITISETTLPHKKSIFEAARTSDIQTLNLFLETQGISCIHQKEQTSPYNSVLAIAAKYANLETVQWLVEHGADINTKTEDDKSILYKTTLEHNASPEEQRKKIDYLLKKGCQIQNNLFLSVYHENFEELKKKLEREDNYQIVKEAFMFASAVGQHKVVTWLLRNYSRHSDYSMAINIAAAHGHTESVSVFLEYQLETPLCEYSVDRAYQHAAKNAHIECMDFIFGSFDHSLTDRGITNAYLEAVKNGHQNVLKWLVENHKDKFTPQFYLSAIEDNWADIQYLPKDVVDDDFLLAMVNKDGESLQYIPEEKRTGQIYRDAVKNKPSALAFVPKNKLTIQLIEPILDDDAKILKHIPEQNFTEKLCLDLVKINWNAIKYCPLNLRTDRVCLAAVKKSFFAFEHTPEDKRSFELSLIAVQKYGMNLKFVPKKLYEDPRIDIIFLAAVSRSGLALQYVFPEKKRTLKLCEIAVKNNGEAIAHVPTEFQDALYLTAVQQTGLALGKIDIKKRSPEICLAAVKQDGTAIAHVPEELQDALYLIAVQQNGLALSDIDSKKRSPEICLAAVEQNKDAFNYVPEENRTPAVCIAAVKQNGLLLEAIKNEKQRTKEVCLAAVRQNARALEWVPEQYRADVINELTVDKIIANNFAAIRFFPKQPDYTKDIHRCLSNVEYITVNSSKVTINPELDDIQAIYANKEKRSGKVINIAYSTDHAADDLRNLLTYLRETNKNSDIHLAFIGHANAANDNLGGVKYKDIVAVCKENPRITHIDLLGCNIAKAAKPDKEKQMIADYVEKTKQKEKLKYGLISVLDASFSEAELKKYSDFCKQNKLDGVYILTKNTNGNYGLLSLKFKNNNDYTSFVKKHYDIPTACVSNINKILMGSKNNGLPFPNKSNEMLVIRKEGLPLQKKELKSLQSLMHEKERFDSTHPHYKKDKKTYPFLATIEAKSSDLYESPFKMLVTDIEQEPNIKQKISIKAPTKALHVDTQNKKFLMTRTHLYQSVYTQSFFGTNKSNIAYKALKEEREKEIKEMENPDLAKEYTKAKNLIIIPR